MYKSLIIDFSRVLIFSHADVDSLNKHHAELSNQIANYKVLDHFYLNTELLEYLRSLAGKIDIYLFSDGRLHELPEINNQIDGIFKQIVTAEMIGLKKNDPEAYLALMAKLQLDPDTTLFLDDKEANVTAAAKTGMNAILFTDTMQATLELNLLTD